MHYYFNRGKIAQKMWATSLIFKNGEKVNNLRLGENSPNLVTLISRVFLFSSSSLFLCRVPPRKYKIRNRVISSNSKLSTFDKKQDSQNLIELEVVDF
jgi:hypothetical protein